MESVQGWAESGEKKDLGPKRKEKKKKKKKKQEERLVQMYSKHSKLHHYN